MNLQIVERDFLNFLSNTFGLFEIRSFEELGISGEIKLYKKGERLITQGELAPNIYYFTQGLTRYVSVSPDGKEFTQSFAHGPCIAGSTHAMVRQVPTNFSIEVIEDVLCLEFEWQRFFNAMKKDLGFLETYTRMIEELFIGKCDREYSFVQKTAEERYLDFLEKHSELVDKIPLQYIASYIGITPVALSRIRKKLK